MASAIYKGIFWYISDKVVAKKVKCDPEGNALESVRYTSKSGNNFNHFLEWAFMPKHITGGMSYNYYPRGRVEIKKGRAVIWFNPRLNNERTIKKIKAAFGLETLRLRVSVKSDYSVHYKCEEPGRENTFTYYYKVSFGPWDKRDYYYSSIDCPVSEEEYESVNPPKDRLEYIPDSLPDDVRDRAHALAYEKEVRYLQKEYPGSFDEEAANIEIEFCK